MHRGQTRCEIACKTPKSALFAGFLAGQVELVLDRLLLVRNRPPRLQHRVSPRRACRPAAAPCRGCRARTRSSCRPARSCPPGTPRSPACSGRSRGCSRRPGVPRSRRGGAAPPRRCRRRRTAAGRRRAAAAPAWARAPRPRPPAAPRPAPAGCAACPPSFFFAARSPPPDARVGDESSSPPPEAIAITTAASATASSAAAGSHRTFRDGGVVRGGSSGIRATGVALSIRCVIGACHRAPSRLKDRSRLLRQRARRARPLGRIARHSGADRLGGGRRHVRVGVARVRRRLVHDLMGDLDRASAAPRLPPGHHLEGHRRERVDVDRRPDPAALQLLGRHVGRCAEHRVGLRQVGALDGLRNPQVGQLHRAVAAQQHVARA